MINMKLKAIKDAYSSQVMLQDADGHSRIRFDTIEFFYIVTGFKTVEAYNAHQEEQPTKFLVWNREH